MIVSHVKPVDWVDTGEAGRIQPSAVAELVHTVALEAADIEALRGPQGPQGVPGADGAAGPQGPQGLPGPSDLPLGNLTFSGVGQRIKGNFSSAPVSSRVSFQTSVENAATSVGILPSGAGSVAQLSLEGSSDPDSASYGQFRIEPGAVILSSSGRGVAPVLPICIYLAGMERMRIDAAGLIEARNSPGMGYGAGSGGAVVQQASKLTGVTLNKASGRIRLSDSALAAGASAVFNLNNSLLSEFDLVVVQPVGGYSLNYRVEAIYATNGACVIRVTNITAGSLSESLGINFAIIKGSAA